MSALAQVLEANGLATVGISSMRGQVERARPPRMLHCEFPGRLCKEGNMAIPFSPSDLTAGEVYRFTMSHVVLPDDPYEMFPIEHVTV